MTELIWIIERKNYRAFLLPAEFLCKFWIMRYKNGKGFRFEMNLN